MGFVYRNHICQIIEVRIEHHTVLQRGSEPGQWAVRHSGHCMIFLAFWIPPLPSPSRSESTLTLVQNYPRSAPSVKAIRYLSSLKLSFICAYVEQHQQRWHFPNAGMTILFYVTECTTSPGYSTFNPSGVYRRYSPLAHPNQVVTEKMARQSRSVSTHSNSQSSDNVNFLKIQCPVRPVFQIWVPEIILRRRSINRGTVNGSFS